MPPAPTPTRLQQRALQNVKEACDRRIKAQQRLSDADHEFRRRIIDAGTLGCSLDQIATAAGVSKTRIHQIIRQNK